MRVHHLLRADPSRRVTCGVMSDDSRQLVSRPVWPSRTSLLGRRDLDGACQRTGVTAIDRPTASRLDRIDSALTVGNEADPDKIRRQLTDDRPPRGGRRAAPRSGGDGTLFNEPVLVVNQKVKVLELNNQYSVFNQNGQRIAAVNQVGQTTAKKVMRLVSSLDQFMTHKLEITDTSGSACAAAHPCRRSSSRAGSSSPTATTTRSVPSSRRR